MSRDEIEKRYGNGELTVVWKPSRCIHSQRCFQGLPSVFDPDKRPWVTITGAPSEAIAAQVRRCPSGALSLLEDATATEPPAPVPVATAPARVSKVTRDLLLHRLHEAAELEHSLLCTYLYAAFSLRQGVDEGLTPSQAEATARWRRTIIDVAIEEMGHLTAVWNLTSALGGSPRFGRANFPIDPGLLPAAVVAKLAPFDDALIQHLVHLERPSSSAEPDGPGFAPELVFARGSDRPRLTPMAVDYATVGVLYATIEEELVALVAMHGEEATFCGDPALQLGPDVLALAGAQPVVSASSARAAIRAIVEQGEGAPTHSEGSHFTKFMTVRDELAALRAANPGFQPGWPAATNPALRRPLQATGRVWIQEETAATTVDIANASYALMLRLLAYSYVVAGASAEKRSVVNLAIGLMRAVTLLGERAARLPAGPAHPGCNAGMSFTALRDTAPYPPGPAARRLFRERFGELAAATATLDLADPRAENAARITAELAQRAATDLA